MDEAQRNTLSGTVHGPAVQARDVDTIVMQLGRSAVAGRVPHQLPVHGSRAWVNRHPELSILDQLAAQPLPTRAVLTGMGGVGKTAMAVHWLTQQQDAHPDGELYFDLGGWSGRPPPPPEHVLAAWLRALGVLADDIPHELTELSALYRTITADRSLLILADNAYSAEQIQPLLPGSPACTLLVTSRHRLPTLAMAGFSHVDLDCLSTRDATMLLAGLLPDDRSTETDVLEALANRCHGLPLALAIAGGHLTVRRQHTPARLLARLDADPRHKLQLRLGDLSVGAVLDMSYQDLDAEHARLFRLCALHPGIAFTAGPIAAAWGRSSADTECALATLADANLITEISEDRFRLHDLVRDHADHLVERLEQPGDRDIAARRMITWYLHRTADADLALNSFAPRFGLVFDHLATSSFASPTQARAWFESERATVLGCQRLAADRGWDDLVCQFAEALWNALRPNYSADELLDSQQLGVGAARCCGHVLEAVCLVRVAFALSNRGEHDAAIGTAMAAYDRAIALGHRWTQSAALSTLGRAHLIADEPLDALKAVDRSLEIEKTLPNPERGIALRERHRGQAYSHPAIADYEKAIHHFQLAATLMRSVGDEVARARVLIDLAPALVRTGQATTALADLEGAAGTVRAYGSTGYTADLCAALGHVHAHLGHAHDAHRWYAEALELYGAAGRGAARQREVIAQHRDALPPSTDHSAP